MRVSRVPSGFAGVDQAFEVQGQFGVVAGGHFHRGRDGAVLEALACLDGDGAGGDLHLEGAGGAEVVRLGGGEDAVETVLRRVAPAVGASHRHAGRRGAAVLVHDRCPQSPDRLQVRAFAHVDCPPGAACAARNRHHVQLGGPLLVRDEGDHVPAGADARCEFVARASGQTEWIAPVGADQHQIVGPGFVGHVDQGAAVGEPVRPGPVGGLLGAHEGRGGAGIRAAATTRILQLPGPDPTAPRYAGRRRHVGQHALRGHPRLVLVAGSRDDRLTRAGGHLDPVNVHALRGRREVDEAALRTPRGLDIDASAFDQVRDVATIQCQHGEVEAVAGVHRHHDPGPAGAPARLEVVPGPLRELLGRTARRRDAPDVARHGEGDPAAIGGPGGTHRPGAHRGQHVQFAPDVSVQAGVAQDRGAFRCLGCSLRAGQGGEEDQLASRAPRRPRGDVGFHHGEASAEPQSLLLTRRYLLRNPFTAVLRLDRTKPWERRACILRTAGSGPPPPLWTCPGRSPWSRIAPAPQRPSSLLGSLVCKS